MSFCKKLLFVLLLCSIASAQLGHVRHDLAVYDELGRKVVDINSVNIYLPGTTTNATIYQDPMGTNAITQEITDSSTNTTLSSNTLYWWGPDGFTVTLVRDNGDQITSRGLNASVNRLEIPTYIQTITTTTYGDANSITMGSDSDWVFNAGATAKRLTFTPGTDDSDFRIGSTTYTSDLKLYGGTSDYDLYWDASEYTLELLDNTILAVGTGDDLTLSHNGTTTTMTGAWTQSGTLTVSASDVLFDDTYDIHWDTSEDTLGVLDNAVLGFGNTSVAPDVEVSWDTDSWNWIPSAADTVLEIGDSSASSTGFDVHYYFETAGEFLTDYDGDFVNLTDDMDLRFGTGASANGDFQISSNSSNVLNISQVVADTGTMTIGADGTDIPTTWYAETSSAEITLTGDTVVVDGVDITINDDDILNFGDSSEITIQYDEDGDNDLQITGDVSIEGTTPLLTVGDAGAEDAVISFDGNSQDFYVGLDDTDDDLNIGVGSTPGTTAAIEITEDQRVTITTAINTPYENVTAANVITSNEGGKTFYLNSATEFQSTLPAVSTSAGMVIRFVITAAPSGASYTIITGNSLENVIYGCVQESETDTTEDGPTAQAQDTVTISDGVAVIGDYLEFRCDGTYWYVDGMTAADGGVVFSQAD